MQHFLSNRLYLLWLLFHIQSIRNHVNSMKKITQPPILLFDGVCNLCNASVQFVIEHDKNKLFRFASQQSEVGKSAIQRFNIPSTPIETLILIENDQFFTESDAALRTARYLDAPYSWLYMLRFVPKELRDTAYRFVARNRYRFFGKKEACWMPTRELKERFLG
jgi:predicted DCC family thiol-disulfide oxidoreductase YuxK